jgi:seryl-tRNA synthetase
MNVQVNIQNLFIDAIEQINNLQTSLQKEFEYFAQSVETNLKDSFQEKKLKAKKRQQNILSEIKNTNSKLNDQIEILNEKIFQLEACLLNYGVSPDEIVIYMAKNSKAIEYDIRNYICNNIFQVPEKFHPMVDWQGQEKKLFEHLNSDLDKIAQQKLKPQPEAVRFSNRPLISGHCLIKK